MALDLTFSNRGGSGGSGSSGSSGINYITNPDASDGTTGWATYADTAANIPTDGTGGTATGLTFSASSSAPLRNTASFLMVQANSTSLQGKGVSYDFTIDSADLAKVLKISFDYNASSTFVASNGLTAPLNDGTTSTNAGNSDIEVFIYDVTNAALIPVSPQVIVANGANNFSFGGIFQTRSNSTSYRLILHCSTTSANATGYSFKFDSVYVGSESLVNGYSGSDWLPFTPTGTWTTNTTYSGFYKISGDTIDMQVKLLLSGAPSSGSLKVNLPAGFVIDTSKLAQTDVETTNPQNVNLGLLTIVDRATQTYAGYIAYISTTQVECHFAGVAGAFGIASGIISPTAPFTFGNLDNISFQCRIPIVGLSSNVLLSNDTDSRVCSARASGTASGGTANNVIVFPTTDYDTHGAYSAGSFVAPISGFYNISGYLNASNAAIISVYINNVQSINLGSLPAGGIGTFAGQIRVNAGDSINVRPSANLGSFGAGNNIAFQRISGPASIAATDSVNAKYTGSSQTVGTSLAEIACVSRVYDTHNAYNTSTGLYTAPGSGKYRITFTVRSSTSISASATNSEVSCKLFKNNADMGLVSEFVYQVSAVSLAVFINGTIDVNCLAGDTVAIKIARDAGVSSFALSNDTNNSISFVRIGN